MAMLRKVKKNDFTVIDNNIFKNKNLSLKGKGMICTMLSLPEDWNFSEEGLASLSNDSRTSVRNTLNELMEYGYLTRKQLKDDNGKFINMEYIIYEDPLYQKPTTEKPTAENVHNKELINKELKNNKENNNINIITKEIYKESFEELWKLYPNKKGKTESYKKFVKAIKDGVSIETIRDGIQRYITYIEIEHIKPQYIKNGSTWFNQRCWEDDYSTNRKPTTRDIAPKIKYMDFLKEDSND